MKNPVGYGKMLMQNPMNMPSFWFRLPKKQAKNLTDNGFLIWDWNVDPRDSVGKIVPYKIMENLKRDLKKCTGTPVILLHDRKSTANLLDAVLRYLTENGYVLEPLSEAQIPVNSMDIKG